MRERAPEEIEWLVPGVLKLGWATKLAAREKVGKGTQAWYLISRLERGAPTVFGPAASEKLTALVLTEEPEESTTEKLNLFDVRQAHIIPGYQMRGLPWREKVDTLVKLAVAERRRVLFADNISRATGIEDEAGPELARALEYLMDACKAENLALLVDHHHRKGAGPDEDKSRGSTSIAGATDINIEMFRSGGGRKRRLSALGRVHACNWDRVIELTEDGDDYTEADGEAQTPSAAVQRKLTDRLALQTLGGRATTAEFAAAVELKSQTSARTRLKEIAYPVEGTNGNGQTTIWELARPSGEPVV
jgi:hypothetical protein